MRTSKILLASTSRYRRELLSRLRIPFECVDPEVDEAKHAVPGMSPRALAERLAALKAEAVQARYPDAIVLGGDQLVALDGEALGKPGTVDAAVAQLRRLAGREHELVTAIELRHGARRFPHTDITRLRMRALDEAALRRYVEADLPLDCAGSYKIESLGIALFDAIETGDPTAIQGLPLTAVARALSASGISVP